MIVKLKRAQMSAPGGLDITVKSARGFAKRFAPTWDMVMGHKSGQISDGVYTNAYNVILSLIPDPRQDKALNNPWRQLWRLGQETGEVTLKCYCQDGKFCHTHICIDYATTKWPEAFEDGR